MSTPQTVKTICPYCGVGCGVLASIDEVGVVTTQGDPDHPANRGRLCSKGSALGETVYLQERLLYPEIQGEQVSWEQALATVAGRFTEIIEEHGPDAVAFYVSGQLLTEDYYVANKLIKGYIGCANIDTNSRLCMSSAVAAHKRAFGEDVVPGCYEDLDRADMIVITGSNTAWCHPILFQRMARAKQNRPELCIVVIDPRNTQTTSIADLHLALQPGTDSTLFNGLLTYLAQHDEHNDRFTEHFTTGVEGALQAARDSAPTIETVAQQCGLSVADVTQFYQKFGTTERVVTAFSQGVNQSSSGVDKINAIINCHLFTGRIGRPGMGPFSITGQPNAMGGREVGGLANQLAAHMDIDNPEHQQRVQRFWQSPVMAKKEGYKAVDLFDAVAEGKIKAVWIMATNPVVSLPNADKVKTALEQCELVVVSDCVRATDTADVANILLPALTWGERDGTVTNSERCISRQHPFLSHPGQAKADWWIITQVAHLMGFAEAFRYHHPIDIFCEHAQLSAFENDGERAFDLGALSHLSYQAYNTLQPTQWPVTKANPQGTQRLYRTGRFHTADGKAKFIAITPRPPVNQPNAQYPFTLNTGRIRDQWHTMTRTGMSPRLSSHLFEPYVEIHPDDAADANLKAGALVKLSNPQGNIFVRVSISDKQRRGSLFVPMHWNSQFASNARVGTLIAPVTDPISGQPESKHSIAAIEACQPNWFGFILSTRGHLTLEYSNYWARSRGKGLWRYEIAGQAKPDDWANRARALLSDEEDGDSNWIEYFDAAKHQYRAARLVRGRLESCIFIAPSLHLPPREWLISLFQQTTLNKQERAALLTGTPPTDQEDTGRIVCACFNVGEKTLQNAINTLGLTTPEAIGAQLEAGTNCGSCIPELRELLAKSP